MENLSISTDYDLHPVIQKLLLKRGIPASAFSEYFSSQLKDLPVLTEMIDLKKASDRLLKALDENELIGVYGDYDVDGTTSCALLCRFFEMLGTKIKTYQPSRFVEGYGVHPSSIDQAVQDGVKVLITVDCGITNVQTAEYAKDKLDLIITDHHRDAAEKIPEAYAVINPSRRDEPLDSPLKPMAGVGVAFSLALQLKNDLESRGKKIPSLYPLLQFVAIGTISDLAQMTPMNLKLTRHGLKQIPTTQYPGIKVFFHPDELKYPTISYEKISFHVGPHINSKGRLDHPERALQLLLSNDFTECREHFSHLEIANKERRFIQAQVFEEAKKQVLKNLSGDEHLSCILYEPHWHEGVIGIVASKLVETFDVPSLVFCDAEHEGVIKASARTSGALNLFELLQECQEFFIKFGGHKAAAGLSMKKENFHAFKEKFNSLVANIPKSLRSKSRVFDLEISFNDIDAKLIKELERLEPYGPGHEKPVFRMKDATILSYKTMKDLHVRWLISSRQKKSMQLQGLSFNYIGKWNEPSPEEIFKAQEQAGLIIDFTLGVNRFQGNETIQLMVERLIPGTLS